MCVFRPFSTVTLKVREIQSVDYNAQIIHTDVVADVASDILRLGFVIGGISC